MTLKNRATIRVLKFGGTSVKDLKSREKCITRIRENLDESPIVVVVSAEAGVTNKLHDKISRAKEEMQVNFSQEEIDLIITAGENISAGLFSAQLNSAGIRAKPLCGWQVPIMTQQSKISDVNISKLEALSSEGYVPVITGFQGIEDGVITSLDRGGSDITAVFLAKALGSQECYIYTDVPGIYRFSPMLCNPDSNEIIQILNYEDAHILAKNGAKVIHHDAVRIAKENNIGLHILSYDHEHPNTSTKICNSNQKQYGISCKPRTGSLEILVLHNKHGILAGAYEEIIKYSKKNHEIIQSTETYEHFRVPEAELHVLRECLDEYIRG